MFSSPLTYALLGLCSLPLGAMGFGMAKVGWDALESKSNQAHAIVNEVRFAW